MTLGYHSKGAAMRGTRMNRIIGQVVAIAALGIGALGVVAVANVSHGSAHHTHDAGRTWSGNR
jgi:hypothetical protein